MTRWLTLHVQVWDCNKEAPAQLGGPFNLIMASNAVHTCDDMAGEEATAFVFKHAWAKVCCLLGKEQPLHCMPGRPLCLVMSWQDRKDGGSCVPQKRIAATGMLTSTQVAWVTCCVMFLVGAVTTLPCALQ